MSYYIVLDGEMGGIGMQYSLLTMYFAIYDDKYNPIADLYLKTKPDDGIYHVNAEALSINQINLIEHDKVAVPYKKAGTILYQFLDRHKKPADRYIPVGHNMSGDLDHIWDKLIGRGNWESFVSYRRLDTSSVIQYLKSKGTLPDTVTGGLENIIEYLGLPKGQQHDAKYDATSTLEVLKLLLKL